MDYLLKASAVLFIFYVCYQLFLQKETFFQVNRWFLLAGLVIACLIPLVVIPVYIEFTVTNTNNFVVSYDNLTPQTIIEEPFDYMQLIIWIYFTGILFFFGKLIVDFLSLRKVLNSSTIKPLESYKLLETNRNIAPFSFFDRIVYNPKKFNDEELQHVINHEKVHTQQWHSLDTIISQLACILFWFNPIVWLYKKIVQQNLEFIADQKAQHVSPCEKSYQTVLLKTSLQNHQLVFTNNFYTSLIKKRIVMLHKSKSKKINQLKMVVVIPLLALFMMSFNTEDVYVEIPLEEEPNMEIFQTKDIEQIFTKDMSDEDLIIIKKKLADKGVTFKYSGIQRDKNGNITAIKTEFKYNGNSGTYNINSDKAMEPFIFKSSEDSFVVGNFTDRTSKTYSTESGKTKVQVSGSGSNKVYVIEEVDEDEEKSSQGINKEASVIVHKTKTWTDKEGEKTSINASANGNTYRFTTQGDEPLYIVNGVEKSKNFFKEIDANDIESMSVLKDKSATDLYGERGKHGVIKMTTKASSKWKIAGKENESMTYRLVTPSGSSNETQYYSTLPKVEDKDLLFIVDGIEGSQRDFKKVTPDVIESIKVIKAKEGIEVYGEKGKNGVIIIKTKPGRQIKSTNNSTIIEVEEVKSPWKISSEVQAVAYYQVGDNGETSSEFVISKTSTESFLEKQKQELKKYGIDAKFSKVRRNKAGKITGIKISLDDNNGQKSSASWKGKTKGIPDLVLGKSKDDTLFVRAINN